MSPFPFLAIFYQSSTFHHHVSSQSCYKPTADTSNALSTVWPTSREMKRTIIQNSHLPWVMSHSWKEGNNTIVEEKGRFSFSSGCLQCSKAGDELRKRPQEGLWRRQGSTNTDPQRQKPKHHWWTISQKPFSWLKFNYQKQLMYTTCFVHSSILFPWGFICVYHLPQTWLRVQRGQTPCEYFLYPPQRPQSCYP